MVDGMLVVVGRSQQAVSAVTSSIIVPLLVAGLVICISALSIGYVLSRSVSVKLQVIDDTLGEVSRGNSDVRLPIGKFDDQIDHVSRQINTHLARLSEFMGLMRNTIVAIAHDLKSPLNRAYILLQETSTQESGVPSEKLDRALSELDTLGDVLDTVLRISRIESLGDNSAFAAFSPADLMRDLVQTFEPVVEAAGQTLSSAIPPGESASILGDARMVQQMLVNLIENASRHSGSGTHIHLELHAVSGAARISIADDGRGIPSERYEDVFQPFRRLEADRHTTGAGLGLTLVRAVATRHHARIDLSDNAPGLKVMITFPRMRASA
jgi:signal transduction histidine kinase